MTPGQAIAPPPSDAMLNSRLKMKGYRVVDARDGSVLVRAKLVPSLAEREAEKLVRKGIPAIVEEVRAA